MATINKTIEYVDGVKVNAYDEEAKYKWLSELDGLISREVMQRDEPVEYRFPDDGDRELLVGAPYDAIYPLYMEAQIDFHNREYGNYNNTILMFNSKLDDYKKAYIRDNMPKSHGDFKFK